MLQLDPGADRGRGRLQRPGDRGDGGPLGQGHYPRVASTGTSPLPTAAAV
jgi:hypothetical protein